MLQIFNCTTCGTKRIYGDTILHAEPENLEPRLMCEGACRRETVHMYSGLSVSCSNLAETLIEQSKRCYWNRADQRFEPVDVEGSVQ